MGAHGVPHFGLFHPEQSPARCERVEEPQVGSGRFGYVWDPHLTGRGILYTSLGAQIALPMLQSRFSTHTCSIALSEENAQAFLEHGYSTTLVKQLSRRNMDLFAVAKE